MIWTSRKHNGKLAGLCLAACLGLALTLDPATGRSQGQDRAVEVKVAFLYNFMKFVEWPTQSFIQAPESFRLCIFGAHEFGQHLGRLSGKSVQGRRIDVIDQIAGDLSDCHLLFVTQAVRPLVPDLLESVKGKAILTVADHDGFAGRGGIINLYLDSGKVRFEVNSQAAQNAGLQLSSQLLKLARIVETERKQ